MAVGDFNRDRNPDIACTSYGEPKLQYRSFNVDGKTGVALHREPRSLRLSFASTTTSICTVSVSTVTPLAAGRCPAGSTKPRVSCSSCAGELCWG